VARPKDPHALPTRRSLARADGADLLDLNPAYAQVQNEHFWAVAWADIMTAACAAGGGGEGVQAVEEIFAKYRSRRVERLCRRIALKAFITLRAVDRRRGRAHFLEADGSRANVHGGRTNVGRMDDGDSDAAFGGSRLARLVAPGHSPAPSSQCAGEDR